MSSVERFFEQAKIAAEEQKKINDRESRLNVPGFKLYDFMGQGENAISSHIKNILDVNGKHGQGALYLKMFLRMILPEFSAEITEQDILKSRIELERRTSTADNEAARNRFIDIYIELDEFGVIAIENKPWAVDQENQLSDYAQYTQKDSAGRKWVLIFLSNREPAEYSIKRVELERYQESGNYIKVGFGEIVKWLDSCFDKTRQENVRFVLKGISQLIDEQVNGRVEQESNQEVARLINSTEDIETAFAIYGGLQQKKTALLHVLKSGLTQLGLEVSEWKISNGLELNTYFSVPLGKINEELLSFTINFDGPGLTGLAWGISTNTKHIVRTEALDELCNNLSRKYGTGKTDGYWPWWRWGDDEPGGMFFRDWNNRPEPWIAIQNGQMASAIDKTFKEVKHLFHS